jgi:hypothetical protein
MEAGGVVGWFVHPPPIKAVPTEGLVAIASVAVVIWTGGFIVRGWRGSTSIGLVAGMNYLQFAFFTAIVALLANALTLRCVATAFFCYYAAFFLRHSAFLQTREPKMELFLPYLADIRIRGRALFLVLQLIEFAPILLTIVWPDPRVVAWACAGMTFFGYQIILAFVYSDLYTVTPKDPP